MTTKELKYGPIVASNIFVIKQLDILGLDKHYLGYFMLVEIMNILINENFMRGISFSRVVYPRVAVLFNKTICTVERNIRNLIDKSWSNELMIKLKFYLPENQKPCCADFIYMVKNFIVEQIN